MLWLMQAGRRVAARPYASLLLAAVILATPQFAFAQCAGVCIGEEEYVGETETHCFCMNRLLVANIRTIKNAVAAGKQPSFRAVWENYTIFLAKHVATGLAPDQNRCAITLSLTLGLRPYPGEHSIADLGDPGMIDRLIRAVRSAMPGDPGSVGGPHIIPEVTNAQIAKRYYIRSEELAGRLRKEWGEPDELKQSDARESIKGKKGVIFLLHAYPEASHVGRRAGNHIDVWDGHRLGSTASLPLEHAEKIWFWEFEH
jgi:hypothetical protein